MGQTAVLRDRVAEWGKVPVPRLECSPPSEGMNIHCFGEAAEYL